MPQDLVVWLHEREPRSVQQLAEPANDYSLVRRSGGKTTAPKYAASSPGSSRA